MCALCVFFVCVALITKLLNGFCVIVPTASSNKVIVFSAVTLLLTTLAHILINACVCDLESHVGKQSSPSLNPAPSVQGAHGGQSEFG